MLKILVPILAGWNEDLRFHASDKEPVGYSLGRCLARFVTVKADVDAADFRIVFQHLKQHFV